MEQYSFKIVTVGLIPFSEDHLKHISINLGIEPNKIITIDSKKRLMIRDQDKELKIYERSKNAFEEYSGALECEYIIINPYGEDDKKAWENRIWGVQLVIDQFIAIITKYKNQKILLVLTGPSCIGKGPLENIFFNEIIKKEKLNVGKCVLYVDKTERPIRENESEGNPYYFTTLDDIEYKNTTEPKRFIKFKVRSVYQLLDLENVKMLLDENDIVFLEVFYSAIPLLRNLVYEL